MEVGSGEKVLLKRSKTQGLNVGCGRGERVRPRVRASESALPTRPAGPGPVQTDPGHKGQEVQGSLG